MIAAAWLFAKNPLGRNIIIASIAMILIFATFAKVQNDAENKAIANIERSNGRARDAADKAGVSPQTCAGVWNRSTGKCD